MGYEKDRKKRNKKLKRQIKKYIRLGLSILIVFLLLWWLLHFVGDMQSTIIGLQETVNQQGSEIANLKGQLSASVAENENLKVKINGLTQYIVDLKEQSISQYTPSVDLGESEEIEKDNTIVGKEKVAVIGGVPVLVGLYAIMKRIVSPGVSNFMGGM